MPPRSNASPVVEPGRWFVIVNPVAGRGRGLDHFPQISRYFRDLGILTEPVFTDHKYHATELAVEAVRRGFRHIAVVGGEGTLHEVVNGLFIQQEVPPQEVLLAAIATGSYNDWARNIGIPLRYAQAVRAIKAGHSYQHDAGKVCYEEAQFGQTRYVFNEAAVELGLWPFRRFRRILRSRRGRMLYHSRLYLDPQREYRMRLDGEQLQAVPTRFEVLPQAIRVVVSEDFLLYLQPKMRK